jgi:hypothetical protein
LAFVLGGRVEGDEVELFAKAAADTGAINLLDLTAGEIGGDVGEHPPGNEQIVPGEKDLGHDIAVVSIVFQTVFGSKVVKAIDFGDIVFK